MDSEVGEDFHKIVDVFAEMREKMRYSQKYSGKGASIDKFYEAIRQFAYEIGETPPYLPIADE
jgi:hypothetical protein